MKANKFLIVMILVILVTTGLKSYSQGNGSRQVGDGIIKGEVVDSTTKQPIHYATVSIINAKDSTIVDGSLTKENGKFEIKGLPNGEYLVKGSFVGFKNTFVSKVAIVKGKNVVDIGRIRLLPSAVMAEQIEVTAEKEQITYNIDKKVINVSQFPTAAGGTAIDVLQNVPSVTIDNEGKVSLRGSANFTLLIDGRPTAIDANTLLAQTPANILDNIEIITNPSAKYDPDGTSGIINLKTKKDKLQGITGIVNMSAGYKDKYNMDFNLNYRKANYNMYFGADASSHKHYIYSLLNRESYNGNDTNFITAEMNRIFEHYGFGLKAGIDINLKYNNTLSFSTEFNRFNYNRTYPAKYHLWSNISDENSNFWNIDNGKSGNNAFNISTNWQKKFEEQGHTLDVNLSINKFGGFADNSIDKFVSDSIFSYQGTVASKQKNSINAEDDLIRGEINYVLPLSKESNYEAGALINYKNKDAKHNYKFLNLESLKWEDFNLFTGNLIFQENTFAVYNTYSNSIFGIDYKLGLRGEYYKRNLETKNDLLPFKYSKFNLFPSLHLSKAFKNNYSLQFSYSRRILRPDEQFLMPYPFGYDDYVINIGNTKLEPEYTDSYELNLRKDMNKAYFAIEAFYRQTNNVISRTAKVLDDGRLALSYDNLNKDYMAGATISANFEIAKWFKINLASDIYNYHVIQDIDNLQKEISTNVVNGIANVILLPTKNTYLQINATYYGTQLFADGKMEPIFIGSCSIKQDFFKKKFSAILRMQDFLSTYKNKIYNERINYKSSFIMDWEHQVITLTLSYKLNNYQQRQRKSDVNIEQEMNAGGGISM